MHTISAHECARVCTSHGLDGAQDDVWVSQHGPELGIVAHAAAATTGGQCAEQAADLDRRQYPQVDSAASRSAALSATGDHVTVPDPLNLHTHA